MRVLKSELFTGEATGAKLLLGWILGIAAAYAIIILFVIAGLYNNTNDAIWLGSMACALGLSTWQAVLLLPTWGRRFCWILAFYGISLFGADPVNTPKWFDEVSIAAAIHGLILVGVRQRVWIWSVLAITLYALHLSSYRVLLTSYDSAYALVIRYLPANYVLPFGDFYPFVATIPFGFAAAFLMPPVEKVARTRELTC